jgi:predicted membrane protein
VWTVPREITIYSLLGSVELDFTDAVFQHPDVTIKIIGGLSSLEVFVPEEITISTNVFSVLGSTENKAPSMGNLKQAPHIRIEGFQLLGSVEVKVKRTIKEKFVAFANSLKGTFQSR